MLQSFWSYVTTTPQKSSQPELKPRKEPEGSPTTIIEQLEQHLDMPRSSQRLTTPRYNEGNDESVGSPNTKRKKHKKKAKEITESTIEVPATAEEPEYGAETVEDEMMADISNAEVAGKRKRRKNDPESTEKKTKRVRKHRKNVEDGEQIVVNGFTPINGEVEGEGEDHPDIPGVRWFGNVPGVLHEGVWVEADISQIEVPKSQKKKKKTTAEVEAEPAPEPEEQEPETVIEETDRGEEEIDTRRKTRNQRKKESNTHHEPAPELEEEEEEPQPDPEAGEEEEAPKKEKKERPKRSRKLPESEPPAESSTKESKRRKSSGDSSESTRRRTYSRSADDINLPPVIIPTATDGSHGNSKGVARPPTPEVYDKGSYTPAEDALIHNVIHRYCQAQIPPLNRTAFVNILWNNDRHKTDFWNILMTNLPLRPRQSLHSHVKRMYHNFEDRGKWTDEQDDELRDLVAQKGAKWSVIGNLLQRMPEDCRDRWKNYVVCGEKRRTNNWDDNETEKLLGILDNMLTTLVEDHEDKGTLVLKAVEGEGEEERATRMENEKGYHREEIDWTIVSEWMGHTRSRMQCLAKAKALWEKAASGLEYGSVRKSQAGYKNDNQKEKKQRSAKKSRKKKQAEKEEEEEAETISSAAVTEAKKMLPGDYLYIMQRISVQGYDCLASIDWNKIAEIDTVKHFTPEQFKAGFHKYLRDYNPEKKDLRKFVAEQLGDFSELPALVRNKRYRPPVGTTSPAVAAAPPTTEKSKDKTQGRRKKQDRAKQPELSVEIQAATSDADSQRSSPPQRLNITEVPTHSPGNPFAKDPKRRKKAKSPSTSRTRGNTTADTPKKSPKKLFKSAEYISDSEDREDENKGAEEEEVQEENSMEVDGEGGEEEGEVELERGSEADDEMGESVAFGNASKDRRR